MAEPIPQRYDEMSDDTGLDLAARFLLAHAREDWTTTSLRIVQSDASRLTEAAEKARSERERFRADFPSLANAPEVQRLDARLEEAICFLESKQKEGEEGERGEL